VITLRVRLLACAVALVGGLLASAAAEAQAPAAPARLTFGGANATRDKGHLALTARLTTADGKPATERRLDFYERVRFFGARDALIGSARTDATGQAALAYQPAQVGHPAILVRFAGDERLGPAEVEGVVEVAEAHPPFEREPLPLGLVGRWLPFVLGGLVFATWSVLLGVLLGTAVGIRNAVRAPAAEREAVTAPDTGAARGR
jgi:hypothetical protein